MKEFREIGIKEDLINILNKIGYELPTEVQKQTIPLILEGYDVVAESFTGSGKTFAFSIGILQNSDKNKGITSLIITPTRELADQINKELLKFSKNKLRTALIFGGVSITKQFDDLKRANVVIATPGRLLDHIHRGTINLKFISTVVLDEADRMFDMGFIEDIKEILKHCPKNRQTLLFSATISDKIISLAKRFMREYKVVRIKNKLSSKLIQEYYDVNRKLKFPLLVNLIKKNKGLSMVFCNTRRNVDFVAKNLRENNINVLAIHGGFTQDKRLKNMDRFHKNKADVLVCTDVAARGIDVKGIDFVYNYDVPNDTKQYVHRIGRTARAGKDGKAITILCENDYDNFRRILNTEKPKIEEKHTPKLSRVKILSSRR